MSLLSELEELQRCLEDTTDSEPETELQQKEPQVDHGNDLDILIRSEYMSLTGISDENSRPPPSHSTSEDAAEAKEQDVNLEFTGAPAAIDVKLNSKQDTPTSEIIPKLTDDASNSEITSKLSCDGTPSGSGLDDQTTEESTVIDSAKSTAESESSDVNVKNREDKAPTGTSSMNTKSESVSCYANSKSREDAARSATNTEGTTTSFSCVVSPKSTRSDPSESTKSDASESKKSDPLECTKSDPSESTKSDPSESTKPDLSESTKSDPSKFIKSDPSKFTKLDPSKSTKLNSSKSTKPDLSRSTKSDPSKSTESDPSESTKIDPSESTKSHPSESTKSHCSLVDRKSTKIASMLNFSIENLKSVIELNSNTVNSELAELVAADSSVASDPIEPSTVVDEKKERNLVVQINKLNSEKLLGKKTVETLKKEDSPTNYFPKISEVFSMTGNPPAGSLVTKGSTNGVDVNVNKRKLSETPSPTVTSPVKKRKLYTEPPVESDLVEVPKGATSPEALLKLQNSNHLLKVRKVRSSPVVKKRKLLEGADLPSEEKRKKVSTKNVTKNVGSTLPVEVVVSPLGAKEPLLEQVAERLGKELLEARVVLKRINIPIPEDLEAAGNTIELQNTLEEVSKQIVDTLDNVNPQKGKKPKGKLKILQEKISSPQRVEEAKPLQKRPPGRPKKSAICVKPSISERTEPKRNKIFAKKILASKLQSRHVKNVGLKKRNNIAFAKQNSFLRSKAMISDAKKNSASINELKTKEFNKTQNQKKAVPTKRINFSPQKKIMQVQNNEISVEKKALLKKVEKKAPLKKVIASPKKVTGPLKKVATPLKKVAVSLKKVATPLKKTAAPLKTAAAPLKTATAPLKKAAAPLKKVAPPHKKVANDSVPRKLNKKVTNIKSRKKAIIKFPNLEVRRITENQSPVKKKGARKKNVTVLSPKIQITKKDSNKKQVSKPQLKITKLSPIERPRKNMEGTLQRIEKQKPQAVNKEKEDNGGEEEWLVEYLIDEDVDMSAVKESGKVSSSDDKRPSSSVSVPECDSSTDKKVRNSRKSMSGIGIETPCETDITTERKMAEMRKAITDLERVADRSMLRLKAEERQVIYLTNKLHYYENDKHYKMLSTILKDAAPGPKQNSDAVFILDLLLSYCPDDNNEDCDQAGSPTSQTCDK